MTINQKSRIKNNKITKDKAKELKESRKLKQPFIKGITVKIFTMTPKKPNSAIRKVAKVKVNKNIGKKRGKDNLILAYIPGEKHSLSIHNLVLIRPGRTKDLPGLKYKIVRNVLDCK